MEVNLEERIGARTWTATAGEMPLVVRRVERSRLSFYQYLQSVEELLGFTPRILYAGEDAKGTPCTMEAYITDGLPLSEVNMAGAMEKVSLLLHSLAKCLERMQARRLVHGDIKPENILVSPGSQKVFFVDWEFGAVLKSDFAESRGYTPFFASEEQVYSRCVGPKTDIRALGLTLMELYLGHHPVNIQGLRGNKEIAEKVSTAEIISHDDDVFLALLSQMTAPLYPDRPGIEVVLRKVETLCPR